MSIRSTALVPALLLVVLPLACRTHSTQPTTVTGPAVQATDPEPVDFVEDPELQGLRVRLSEADAPPDGPIRQAVADSEQLSETESARLLGRLPELEYDGGVDFALRSSSRPAPRPGSEVAVPFPPDPNTLEPVRAAPGPLAVLRHSPDGDVPIAAQVSVTFNQPMVAITSQDEASLTRPVLLEPEPEGNWRWIGTKTVLFDPGTTRLPMATSYTIRVPAGTTSATGEAMAAEQSWTFATPAPRVLSWTPNSWGPVGTEPVIVLVFDQRVDPVEMARHVVLSADGAASKPIQLRPATAEEIEADPAAKAVVAAAEPDRFVAFRALAPLSKATGHTLTLTQGAPSAEGPLTTPNAQTAWFTTFHPLQVTEHACSWGDACPPESSFYVSFNNPLDPLAFKASSLKVAPDIRAFRAYASGNWLTIDGIKQGRTTYTVVLPAGLQDSFGQTLGAEQTLTFDVGPATQQLSGPAGSMVVLDPAGEPVIPIYSTNHRKLRARIYKVEPKDWKGIGRWARDYYDHQGRRGGPPGIRVADTTIKVDSEPDRLTETAVDLGPYLKDGHGQLFVWIEPTKQPRNYWERQYLMFWVQATDIGLSATVDQTDLLGWATSLQDGASLEDVELEIFPGGAKKKTDSDGLSLLPLPENPASEEPQILIARRGSDMALLPQTPNWWNDYPGWRKSESGDVVTWFTFDDRGLYKPKESAHIKGWLRTMEPRVGGDLRALSNPTDSEVTWTAYDARYSEIGKGTAEVSKTGGFDFEVAIPDDANLGAGWVELYVSDTTGGTYHRHSLNIAEFRRPEFEVVADADAGPHLLGGKAIVEVSAAYFSGGGLPGAETTWRVWVEDGSFTPPERSDWSFGSWTPWWRWDWGAAASTGVPAGELQVKTDGGGKHRLRIDFEALNPPRPMSVRAEATVLDVNRQAWTAQTPILLHPADLYVGLKSERPFVHAGDPIRVDSIVVGLDGASHPGRETTVTLVRLAWETVDGVWTQVEKAPQQCVVMSLDEGVRCEWTPEEGGSYKVTAQIRDDEGRANESELYLWVAGGEGSPQRGVQQQEVTLIPSGESFAPGDTAEILVQAPFFPAEGLMSIRRSGVVRTERFRMETASHLLEIPIEDQHVPDLTVQVDLVGETTRTDDAGEPLPDAPKRPAFASGNLQLKVPPLTRTLSLEVVPDDETVEPGAKTGLTLQLRDAAGRPVQGEVALVVVDEAVLSLTGYRIADPLETFYALRGPGAWDHHMRALLLLADPLAVQAAANAPGGGVGLLGATGYGGGGAMAGDGEMMMEADAASMPMDESRSRAEAPKRSSGRAAQEPMAAPVTVATRDDDDHDKQPPVDVGEAISVRSDFRALAAFEPSVMTDAQGRATVPLALPDSLTRYRVMAVAVAGENNFGSGEATITARKPVQVRPSPPRFLNFGDVFELPVVVQNQTDEPAVVSVAVRTVGFELTGPVGKKLTVPPGDRAEVRFPAAARRPGTGRYQVVIEGTPARSGRDLPVWNDAAEGELPIWTPATTEAFATYGVIDEGAILQPVEAPPEVWTEFGGLDITTSSTALQALTDAFIYLVEYPYECSEQLSSRVLSIAALRDVLDAFEAEGLPPAAELEAALARDMGKLKGRQRWNGGFGLWSRYDGYEWPYVSVHVMHSLALAKDKGFDVPDGMIPSGLNYLRSIESYIPYFYSQETKWTIRAYAVYVRELLGDDPIGKAKELYREGGTARLPLEAQGWILPTLHRHKRTADVDAIVRHWENNVSETAGAANFVTSYGDSAYLLMHSNRRTDGVLLEALTRVRPEHDLIPKVVTGLLAHRKRGRWGNTQENGLILVALDRYFRTFEAVEPNFVARVWLGDGYAGDHTFVGRTTERATITVPMDWLAAKEGRQDLVLHKDGEGRMYYRIGMRYAPRSLELQPADHGFAVTRQYEPVDDDGDVWRTDDGVWHVKAGARVRVRVTMVAESRRYHVALVDPMPAGLEAINPELKTSETLPEDTAASTDRHGGGRWYWWWGSWYEHDNLRDERAEAFSSLLWDGVYEYTYVARATTPGLFIVPPPKAEEMYSPETFGRGATARVSVE